MVIIHQNNLEESMLLKISARISPSFWYQMALSRVLAHGLLARLGGIIQHQVSPSRRNNVLSRLATITNFKMAP